MKRQTILQKSTTENMVVISRPTAGIDITWISYSDLAKMVICRA